MGTILVAILFIVSCVAGVRFLKILIKGINSLFDKVESWF